MDRFRLESFSDGVFAVAITLLAVNITIGGSVNGVLLHQVLNQWPTYVAYLVSFFTIGIIWVNHHALVRDMVVIDRVLLFLNLVLLLFVVLIPSSTAAMARYLSTGGENSRVAMALYCIIFDGMSLSFGAIFEWTLHGKRMRYTIPSEKRRLVRLRFTAGALAYLVATGIALVSAPAALVIIGLVAVYYMAEHTPVLEDPHHRTDDAPRQRAAEQEHVMGEQHAGSDRGGPTGD